MPFYKQSDILIRSEDILNEIKIEIFSAAYIHWTQGLRGADKNDKTKCNISKELDSRVCPLFRLYIPRRCGQKFWNQAVEQMARYLSVLPSSDWSCFRSSGWGACLSSALVFTSPPFRFSTSPALGQLTGMTWVLSSRVSHLTCIWQEQVGWGTRLVLGPCALGTHHLELTGMTWVLRNQRSRHKNNGEWAECSMSVCMASLAQ